MTSGKYEHPLTDVEPAALAGYAVAHGWTKTVSLGEYADLYESEIHPNIVVPKTHSVTDYDLILGQLIDAFARANGVDGARVLDDLMLYRWDIVRYRARGSERRFVEYADGRRLVDGVHSIMTATACSLIEESGVYTDAQRRQAGRMLRGMKLDQSEYGSYVIKLLMPVDRPRLFDGSSNGGVRVPEGRRITRRLESALASIRSAVDLGASESFVEGIQAGVSADLCRALAKAIEPYDVVDIRLDWAGEFRRASEHEVFSFTNDESASLSDAAVVLQEKTADLRAVDRFPGYVRQLNRPKDSFAGTGTVILETFVDGNLVSIKCELSGPDYGLAMQAHREKVNVLMRGRLRREGRQRTLKDCTIEQVFGLEGNDADPTVAPAIVAPALIG